jgi:nitrile hydratase accessory protein
VIDLDADGRAAPPRLNGELVFEHPWQSRIFATTMALCDAGVISYEDFRARLIVEIAQHPDEYWHSWSGALEVLLVERELCDADEVTDRARRFVEHD